MDLARVVLEQNVLTEKEVLGLRSLANEMSNRDLQTCEQCMKPPKGIKTRDLKKQYGHDGNGHQTYYLKSDGTRYWTCPRIYQLEGLGEYLKAYIWYEDSGALPVFGGLEDQPHKFIEAMEVIRNEFRMIEKVKHEQSEREARKNRKR